MISYELAKKLRGAGFPIMGGFFYLDGQFCHRQIPFDYMGEVISAPTLSELIEAIGTGFDGCRNFKIERLWQESDNGGGFIWYTSLEQPGEEPSIFGEPSIGSTVEESAANLWLELNNQNEGPARKD